MSPPAATTATGAARHEARTVRPGLLLAVLCCAQLILSVDLTVVAVANATIEKALGFTAANLQWTITTYSLTFGGFLLLGGRLGDLYGRRRMFLIGVAGFGLTSLACGLSTSALELIVARALQGLCAALVSPGALSLITSSFAEGRPRQRAFGMWASFGSIGGLTGFLIGGVVTSLLGWRWIFFLNVPIAVAVVIAALAWVRPDPPRASVRSGLDLPGAVSITLAVALVIFGLGQAETAGWTSPATILTLAGAPVCLLFFVAVERRSASPLVPASLLRRRAALANIIAIFQQSIGAATSFLAPLFLQQIWAYSPLLGGAATLPLPLGFVLGARVSSRIVSRYGARRLIIAGFAIVVVGLLGLAHMPTTRDYWATFAPALTIRSFGQGLLIVPLVLTATSGVRKRDQGIAAGLFNTSQQLGGAMGLAAIATVVSASVSAAGHPLAGVAHGFRLGFLVSAGLAVAGGIAAMIVLEKKPSIPRPEDAGDLAAEPLAAELDSGITA